VDRVIITPTQEREIAMKKNQMALMLTAACGAAFGITQGACAQPYVVNTYGATLLTNLLTGSQVNNDFIDVDGDGNSTSTNGVPDNLTQSLTAVTPTSGFIPSNYIVHQYRSVGSVNGLQELIDWGCQADRAGDTNGDLIVSANERFAGLPRRRDRRERRDLPGHAAGRGQPPPPSTA
jgi:hypothetical protein